MRNNKAIIKKREGERESKAEEAKEVFSDPNISYKKVETEKVKEVKELANYVHLLTNISLISPVIFVLLITDCDLFTLITCKSNRFPYIIGNKTFETTFSKK